VCGCPNNTTAQNGYAILCCGIIAIFFDFFPPNNSKVALVELI